MKLALICPSNMLYMPYVSNYEIILKEKTVNYEIINWDRFQIEDRESALKYRDTKTGHQRGYYDYCKYKKFVTDKLNTNSYDKVIVFGIQLTYFLKGILLKKYKTNYVIDIRDHNRIINCFNIKRLIENSAFTVISSPGYKAWLPNNDKYIINHNTQVDSLNQLKDVIVKYKKNIIISNIGLIKHSKINIDFIDSIKGNNLIHLNFHGDGTVTEEIMSYLKINGINNVSFTGRYFKQEEENLYMKSDLINLLVPSSGINNKTLLANRLYNAALYGKPILAYKGTYLAEQIKQYNLGLVMEDFTETEEKITSYLNSFELDQYQKDRVSFFKQVIKDNQKFKMKIREFGCT